MVWNRLSQEARKAILAAMCLVGGTSTSCCVRPPIVCDPAPPPSVTPMICDPPPPPPVVTVAPGQHFTARRVEVQPDVNPGSVSIQGSIVDPSGRGLGGLEVIIETGGEQVRISSDYAGIVLFTGGKPGVYTITVAGDEASQVSLELSDGDQAILEWVETWDEGQVPLPLAEIRTVGIAWLDGLTFVAESPWPAARYRWSVSGGELVGEGERVVWQPPAQPGRYLLQVVADWGRSGVAVDAVVLTVEDDGTVTSG